MNFLVPHLWLSEFCKTPSSPEELSARVSLSGPSIERILRVEGESVYDAEITTNRPDAFSIIGFSREVAAILQAPFKEPLDARVLAQKMKKLLPKKQNTSDYSLSVRIENPNQCSRYVGLVIDNVTVGPSPQWMQKRLEQCGQRPINNIVDITNYVMLEYGQPMHAFDAKKIVTKDRKGAHLLQKEIVVRNAKRGEKFVSLDGDTKALKSSMLVIADHAGPIALAGIKGGKRSGIDGSTNTIILEAAHFNPVNVRTTSREVDIRTDSSSRFEKNLSPELPLYALLRAAELVCELAGGDIIGRVVDQYPRKQKASTISFPPRDVSRVLGVAISPTECSRHLARLGFDVTKTGDALTVRVPFWREGDVENSRDLVEEIGRLHGYDTIPLESVRGPVPLGAREPLFFWESRTKHFLKDRGWTEVMSYSFVSEKLLFRSAIQPHTCVKLYNPLSLEFTHLRTSLLPSIFETLSSNEQKAECLQFFELSATYHPLKKNDLPKEVLVLSGATMRKATEQELLREAKGELCAWAQEVFGARAHEFAFVPVGSGHPWIQEGKGLSIMLGRTHLGFCGIPAEGFLRAFDLKGVPCVFEISFSDALPLMSMSRVYAPIPKFPSSQRDVAFIVSRERSYESLVSAIKKIDPLITSVTLFDIFENAKTGKGRQSLGLRLTYSSQDRTLLSPEVEEIHAKVRSMLSDEFKAELR